MLATCPTPGPMVKSPNGPQRSANSSQPSAASGVRASAQARSFLVR